MSEQLPRRSLFEANDIDGLDLTYLNALGIDEQRIHGYAAAFKILGRHVEKCPSLLFPTLFLFRHFVELQCKRVVEIVESLDWGGNFYCLMLSGPLTGQVIYWDHERDDGDHHVEPVVGSINEFFARLVPDPRNEDD